MTTPTSQPTPTAQVRIKVCGITNLEDARAAVDAGADFLGFILCEASPRYVTPARVRTLAAACPHYVQTVGVFVNVEPADVITILDDCGLDIAQLHGDEPDSWIETVGPHRTWKAIWPGTAADLDAARMIPAAHLLVDAVSGTRRGGTGRTCRWDLAAALSRDCPIVLAGGLRPNNVREAVRTVKPWAVDVSSGVEAAPGRKDHAKLKRFIANARTGLGVPSS